MIIENIGSRAADPYDSLTAIQDDVLTPYTFIGNSKQKLPGKMINYGTVNRSLQTSEVYTIPKGYHNGTGIIKAINLSDQTVGSVTPERMLDGKVAWANGIRIVGNMSDRTGDTASLGFDYNTEYSYILIKNGIYKNFSNSVQFNITSVPSLMMLNMNDIKSGSNIFVNNTGTYTNDATAIAAGVRVGKTIYSKGVKIVGTMTVPTLY